VKLVLVMDSLRTCWPRGHVLQSLALHYLRGGLTLSTVATVERQILIRKVPAS